MNTLTLLRPATERRPQLIAFAGVTALVSLSVHGFWRGVLPFDPAAMLYAQLVLLGALLGVTYLWAAVRSLRGFVLINFALHLSTWVLFTLIGQSAAWIHWFGGRALTTVQQAGDILLKVAQLLIIVAVLFALGLRRADFYLTPGQMDAPLEPVPWLGIRSGTRWMRFGTIFALIAAFGLGSLMALGNRALLAPDILRRALPFVPVILIFAALNAIYEEVAFKAAPLSQLEPTVGKRLALFLTAAMFGLGHFTEQYFPAGMSVVLPAFLGYVLGKSMLETRGIAWAWIIHGVMDVVIFTFLTLAIVAGAA